MITVQTARVINGKRVKTKGKGHNFVKWFYLNKSKFNVHLPQCLNPFVSISSTFVVPVNHFGNLNTVK